MTIDHLDPLSKNGINSIENIACCCYHCNTRKSSMSLSEFLKLMRISELSFYTLRDMQMREYNDRQLAWEKSISIES